MTGVTARDPPLSALFRLAGVKRVALAVTCNVTDVTLLSRERERVSDRKGGDGAKTQSHWRDQERFQTESFI